MSSPESQQVELSEEVEQPTPTEADPTTLEQTPDVPEIVVNGSNDQESAAVDETDAKDLPALPASPALPSIPASQEEQSVKPALTRTETDVPFDEVSLDESQAPSARPASASKPAPVEPPSTPSSNAASSPAPSSSRPRSDTTSTSRTSLNGSRPAPLLSGVLIIASLEQILSSKEAKKNLPLKEATTKALDALKSPTPGALDPRTIFTPLKLACETRSYPLIIAALDCIGKLVSHAGFATAPETPTLNDEQDSDSRRSSNASAQASVFNTTDPDLAEEVVSTICNCFVDTSAGDSSQSASSLASVAKQTGPDAVNLHILSALLSLILSSSLPVHQSSLLKAVRTVYNVFLLSRGQQNQMVAQGALGQIVGAVFGRVGLNNKVEPVVVRQKQQKADEKVEPTQDGEKSQESEDEAEKRPRGSADTVRPPNGEAEDGTERPDSREESKTTEGASTNEPPPQENSMAENVGSPEQPAAELQAQTNGHADTAAQESQEKITLETFEKRNDFENLPDRESLATLSTQDLHVKDAFLVFRALCKLSMKPLGSESERDLRSHAMRSKLLSLHLILTILHNYMPLFVDPTVIIHSASREEQTPFIVAIKQYLCLSLSRNGLSPVLNVFELSCEIFWRMLSGMRTKLKKEIEVLLNEIFLPILEMKSSTVKQKSTLLAVMSRLCHDPQALVEIYINYDCDRSSLDNVYERLINIVSRIGTTHYTTLTVPSVHPNNDIITASPSAASFSSGPPIPNAPNPANLSSWSAETHAYGNMAYETRLKRQSLEALVFTLRSLVSWAGKTSIPLSGSTTELSTAFAAADTNGRLSEDRRFSSSETDLHYAANGDSGTATPDIGDDPGRFENAKQRKTTLLEGIKKFNFKPKRGVKFLIDNGFIRSASPKDVARFLLNADGLNKAMIGEYLGEGDEENIATMHAFVDLMDFTNTRFTDALRTFLQSFRLPGEGQKIDRFMLKFADRYIGGNPTVFANADTAYILAYSTIMLNTDQHSRQVKNRMSKAEFIKNNRGINDGQDVPEEVLTGIFDEIVASEIRMKDEIELAGVQPTSGLAGALAGVGRDLEREAYVLESEGMASKTEGLFRAMLRGQKRGAAARPTEQFYAASSIEHVRPMFAVAWMPILAGISGPLQDSDDIEMINLSLEGFKQAIKIVCLFDLELERNAFVTTLAKFTFLNNFGEMRTKNVEAIRTMLDVAIVDGNYLKSSWREVLTCVSQLERFQLISSGADSKSGADLSRRPGQAPRQGSGRRASTMSRPTDEVANETRSTQITIAADRIFSTSNSLSGNAIVDFVRALADVSWEEIRSSGLTEQPRTFCLQKLVEISYYNMGRIRLEWSNIWAILGEHFNQVCCHTNLKVSFFALDSLRQLASRFLEKEELAHFKFQKDFLKPFEYAMIHNNNPDVRDMILQCFRQMILARVNNLRSGWRTMFGVFSAASKVMAERVASQAFDMVQDLNKEFFSQIIVSGSFADLAVCITDFCKINKYQKISLHAIEMLKGLIPQMIACPECPLSHPNPKIAQEDTQPIDDPMIKYWFPVLFGFYDIIMNGEDLEVRKRALDYLFETLKTHGRAFPPYFWDSVCKEVLFPIFAVLRSRSDVSRFSTHEDMSVWLSTTMIQALRNLIDLFTFYFDVLGRMLDKLLDLLCECICQENDTLARIGTSCLQQLLEKNVKKLSPALWEKIVSTFITLFHTTTAHQLFDERLRAPLSPNEPSASEPAQQPGFIAPVPLDPNTPVNEQRNFNFQPIPDRKKVFRQIIVKCVLQLLLIETAHELLQNEEVYTTIPPADLLKLMAVLDESYQFAKKFNADKDLRMALWKVGFMKQLPNLLKQESSSAATLVSVLMRMLGDQRPEHTAKRGETVEAFTPLGLQIVSNYISLDGETQARNIAAWTPVVTEVLQGFSGYEDVILSDHVYMLYPLAVDMLARDLVPEVRESLRGLFYRIGSVKGLIEGSGSVDDDQA